MALVAALGIGAIACGPPSSRYRGELRDYDRERPPRTVDDGRSLFAGTDELGVAELIVAVLDRNPNLDEARAGWRAALARYPQVTSFEDPMVSYSVAPLSIGSDVPFGQVVEVSQPLPYPGKRRLRGQVALAEADAAREDYRAVRLRVAVMAAHFYYELYVTDRSIAIHAEYQSELEQHRETLTAHLAAGHAWQDDALKVDVELGEVEQARIDLAAERDIIVAQINELLHRSPELPLPPLPATLPTPAALDQPVDELRELAMRERPELRGAAARERRESARIAVADRDFYPDFRVMGSYDSMWPSIEHEIMVGLSVTVPLWRANRHAAVDEAEADRAAATAATAATEDRIRTEVERAFRAYAAALDVLEKYRVDIVPAAQSRVEAIRVGLDSGRTTFIEVLRADHDLLEVRLRYERVLANAYRRKADLDAAVGRLGSAQDEGGAP